MPTLLAALLIAQAHVHGSVDPNAPKPQGSMTKLQVGKQTSQAYVARPRGKPQGALLVLHEYWGLNDWVKHQADELAREGYLALAVDLYKGKVATEPSQAQELKKGRDEKWADQLEEAGLKWLKENGQAGKVATIGWCSGGADSLNASLNSPQDVDATIIYYGPPILDVAKLKTLRGPVLGIWGNKDRGIPPEKVAAFDKALTEAGVKHEFHSFDADHAFANPSGGRFNGEAANDAWGKTLKFLDANVRSK
jgi:carboxymethylenebutenolidase